MPIIDVLLALITPKVETPVTLNVVPTDALPLTLTKANVAAPEVINVLRFVALLTANAPRVELPEICNEPKLSNPEPDNWPVIIVPELLLPILTAPLPLVPI